MKEQAEIEREKREKLMRAGRQLSREAYAALDKHPRTILRFIEACRKAAERVTAYAIPNGWDWPEDPKDYGAETFIRGNKRVSYNLHDRLFTVHERRGDLACDYTGLLDHDRDLAFVLGWFVKDRRSGVAHYFEKRFAEYEERR